MNLRVNSLLKSADKENEQEELMKLKMSASAKEKFESIALKFTALLAFLAINFIGYSAFSAEVAVKWQVDFHMENA